MGIYLGQLPPAEVARLKAELAETIIASFCYPRFFDYRTESLRMRPVDRAKRQEVWLYLSSVDFTAWSRVDLMSPDFQRQIERLFIQFVQRNRSFFGEQGRRRMSDIRMLISSSATSIVQGLRNHITGQRHANVPPFGSPRPVMSWSVTDVKGYVEPSWEQIASSTLLLQQQIQEVRGEVKPAASSDGHTAEKRPANAPAQHVVRPSRPSGPLEQPIGPATVPASNGKTAAQSNTHVTMPPAPLPITSPLPDKKPTTAPLNPPPPRVSAPAASITPVAPAASTAPTAPQAPVRKTLPQASADTPIVTPLSSPKPTAPVAPIEQPRPADPIHNGASTPVKPVTPVEQPTQPTQPTQSAQPIQAVQSVQTQSPMAKVAPAALPPAVAPTPILPTPPMSITPAESQTRSLSPVQSSVTSLASMGRGNPAMRIGEDDIAIFEEMRHQLIVWLRVEAIHAGLEVAGQTPSQLLEVLRRQEYRDETRLQVVSTLLDLSNQVITNGQVTVLDYKQALMFHLMHTRK